MLVIGTIMYLQWTSCTADILICRSKLTAVLMTFRGGPAI